MPRIMLVLQNDIWMPKLQHIPVLCAEAVAGLGLQQGGVYVDATFGGGGHARAILAQLKEGQLYAFDQDAEAATWANGMQRLHFVCDNFAHICSALAERGIAQVSGILADLGMSSLQLQHPQRGFSFMQPTAQLDMRMQLCSRKQTAAELLRNATTQELRRVFEEYGELPRATGIAHTIVKTRKQAPLQTVGQLKEILQGFAPPRHSARFWAQLFQALRIAVNDELEALKALLQQAAKLICAGGRLVVISYHSLEDRLVKRFLRNGHFSRTPLRDSYGRPLPVPFVPLHPRPLCPSEEECTKNPSARSAKMRIGTKTITTNPNNYGKK